MSKYFTFYLIHFQNNIFYRIIEISKNFKLIGINWNEYCFKKQFKFDELNKFN